MMNNADDKFAVYQFNASNQSKLYVSGVINFVWNIKELNLFLD